MTDTDSARPDRFRKKPDTGTEADTNGSVPGNVKSFDFESLAEGGVCIRILLGSEAYTLRKTQSGKLILNK